MGYKKNHDVAEVAHHVICARAMATDRYLDGYTAWYAKQDLYQMKFLIEDALKNCPTFAGEEEWLEEQNKKKVIRILKDEY